MSLSQLVAAPSPVTIGDKTYTASPLNFYDLGTLEEAVRAGILNAAAKATEGLQPAAADRLLDRAFDRASKVSFDSPEMGAFLKTFRGSCAYVSLSLRSSHPDMTEAAVGAAFSKNMDQYAAVVNAVARLSGMDDKGGQSAGEAEAGASKEPSSS